MSKDLEYALSNSSVLEIEAYDLDVLKQLSKGNTVDEISENFKSVGITPNGTSSLEKRIGKLKTYFIFKTVAGFPCKPKASIHQPFIGRCYNKGQAPIPVKLYIPQPLQRFKSF